VVVEWLLGANLPCQLTKEGRIGRAVTEHEV
jgi:hypothetical protein